MSKQEFNKDTALYFIRLRLTNGQNHDNSYLDQTAEQLPGFIALRRITKDDKHLITYVKVKTIARLKINEEQQDKLTKELKPLLELYK